MSTDGIRLFRTIAHRCGYYDDRESINQVLDPQSPQVASHYGLALEHGFRRAGDVVYRPVCVGCSACVPYRLLVAEFTPNRAQRRVLARNTDVVISWRPAGADDEHFALYRAYLGQRHAAGGMDSPSPEDFSRFLLSAWAQTWFMEMRIDQRLVGAAVTDQVANAASAVYTYFAPDLKQRSLGTLAILKQIEYCRQLALPYLYLGFWIASHPKMDYKRNFGPAELRQENRWIKAADD
jgi:leucyl-tRNA---protein transferase